jgi:hypothetical protein
MELFGIDHTAVYGDFRSYIGTLSREELDRRTAGVLAVKSLFPK